MPIDRVSRRRLLSLGLATPALSLLPLGSRASPARGLVLPRQPAPDLPLTDTFGQISGLAGRLRGRISAVQLMFAGCSSVCPIQGAAFGAVAAHTLPAEVQLLSISVDPLGDSPASLTAWLARHGPARHWIAAVPRVADVAALSSFLCGEPPTANRHPTQAFLFDREARLAFRTLDMPGAAHLTELLLQLARA